MKYLTLVVVISMGLLMNGCSSKSNRYLSHWIEDQNGCKRWNPNPVPNEKITWTGKCVNGYIEGYGTLQWYKNGVKTNKTIGKYRHGKREGKGTAYEKGLGKYIGNFSNDLHNGKGTYFHINGTKDIGNWHNAKRDGIFDFFRKDGISYKIEYKNNEPQPYWIKDENGCKTWNPKPQLNETISWTGECVDGYVEGYGTLTWYKNGKLNGSDVGLMREGKVAIEWMLPKNIGCKVSKHNKNTCFTNWQTANEICEQAGARLATKNEYQKVIDDCGGSYIKDGEEKYFKECITKQGLALNKEYWSSTAYNSSPSTKHYIKFDTDNRFATNTPIAIKHMSNIGSVICVKTQARSEFLTLPNFYKSKEYRTNFENKKFKITIDEERPIVYVVKNYPYKKLRLPISDNPNDIECKNNTDTYTRRLGVMEQLFTLGTSHTATVTKHEYTCKTTNEYKNQMKKMITQLKPSNLSSVLNVLNNMKYWKKVSSSENWHVMDFIREAARNSANSSHYDSSSSSNNCSEIKESCRENCKPMSGSASFWSNSYKRNCHSKCTDAYNACKRGNMKEMRRNICKSQCVTKEGGSVLDLKSSERTKCFRGCN